jgi:hypothetical protein
MKVWIEYSHTSIPTKQNRSWFIAIMPVLELRLIDDSMDGGDSFYVLDFGWLFWFWQLFVMEDKQ